MNLLSGSAKSTGMQVHVSVSQEVFPTFVFDSKRVHAVFTYVSFHYVCRSLEVADVHYTTSASRTPNVTSLFLMLKVGKAATYRSASAE